MIDKGDTFENNEFTITKDYISLEEFSKRDYEIVIYYNGCGNIVFHVKTINDEFDEIWVFANKDDQINPIYKKTYEIKPLKLSQTKNLELVKEGELESIDVSFDYFDESKLEKITKEKQKAIEKGEIEITDSMHFTFNSLDDESKTYFRLYNGHGDFKRELFTRDKKNHVVTYYFEGLDFDKNYKDLTDDTIIHILPCDSYDEYFDTCPEQNFIREELTFKPFNEDYYDTLKKPIKPDFNHEGYMKNVNELIESTCFTEDEISLMFENNKSGLIYYQFKTIKNEIIRDCYRISNIYNLNDTGIYYKEDEVEEYNSENEYMIRILPYKLAKRNDFTVPEIEKFGIGYWYYDENLDFVSLSDFNGDDQDKILEYNGCGNIIMEIKSNNDSFSEIWLFDEKINNEKSRLINIFQYEADEENNLLSLTYNDIKEIKYTFEPFSKEKIDELLDDIQKKIENNQEILSESEEINFGLLSDKSKKLFKKYAGKGEILRKVFTKLGKYFIETWEFDCVDRDILLSDINDDTILKLNSESLDNRLNYEFYPIQDLLKIEYSFKPFPNDKYEELSSIEEFDLENYMENGKEFVECFKFSTEDNKLIEEYKDKGLVYYEFKTIFNEVIRDYYEISKMTKHDVDKELEEWGEEIDLELLSEEEILEFKQEYDFYDLELIPYRLDERNDFTVPEIEKFGSGHWYYQIEKNR